MSILNHLKKSLFIYLITFLGISHFAYAGGEISGHFGKKFQKYGAWHFGADALYRISIDENSSFGIGPRYRFYFKSASNSTRISDVSLNLSGKRSKHRVALLLNYRYEMMEGLFMGPIVGVDIWKHYSGNISASASGTGGTASASLLDITSSEFLWNNFTAQFGVEVGYNITPNFLMKLEGGYDLLSFKKCTHSQEGQADEEREGDILCGKFNGVYATVGVGYHF